MPEPGAAAAVAEPRLMLNRRFAPLFWVQALGAFNDNVFKVAFVTLLTFRLADELETDVNTLVAIANGVFILPFALFAPLAGQIADRIDKAQMMRGVKAAEILLMILAAVAFHLQQLTLLFVLVFLMGAQSAFFAPIKYGSLPQYLRTGELMKGNGYIQAGTFFAILLGNIAGANLVLLEGGVTLVSVAVIAIAAVGFFAACRAPSAPPSPDATVEKVDFFLVGAIKQSLQLAYGVPVAFRSIVCISWFWFVGATYLTLLAPFAKDELGADETVLTLLLAAFSIGVAIGAVLCSLLYRGQIRVGYAPWGAVGIAVFSIDLAFALSGYDGPAFDAGAAAEAELIGVGAFLSSWIGWRVLIDFVLLAICAGLYVTPLNAVYQNASPPAIRGRIVASSNMIDATMMTLSAVLIIALGALDLKAYEIYALVGATGIAPAIYVARSAPETRLGRTVLRFWPWRTQL